MKNRLSTFLLFGMLLFSLEAKTQIVYPQGGLLETLIYKVGSDIMPEYGFLGGRKFPTYPTVGRYNFGGLKIRVVFYDDRDSLKLPNVECSETEITGRSELKGMQGTVKVWDYLNTLFAGAHLIIDTNAAETVEVRLTALDARLIGFGEVAAHGICQMDFKYKGVNRIYCTDMEDGDPNAPLGKLSFVTRKTASRFMASAAIRETIEQFLKNLENFR